MVPCRSTVTVENTVSVVPAAAGGGSRHRVVGSGINNLVMEGRCVLIIWLSTRWQLIPGYRFARAMVVVSAVLDRRRGHQPAVVQVYG